MDDILKELRFYEGLIFIVGIVTILIGIGIAAGIFAEDIVDVFIIVIDALIVLFALIYWRTLIIEKRIRES